MSWQDGLPNKYVIQVSCLAKERCSPLIAPFETCYGGRGRFKRKGTFIFVLSRKREVFIGGFENSWAKNQSPSLQACSRTVYTDALQYAVTVSVIWLNYFKVRRTAVAQWLWCCATNRKVAGSIPAGVIGIFHWHKILPIALWPWGRLNL